VVVRQQPTAEQRRDRGGDARRRGDGEDLPPPRRSRLLMPQNPAFEPIAGDEATIMGRVVAVLRRI
jgi:repressor LexA